VLGSVCGKKQSGHGFTLIEVAAGLVVVGLLLATLLPMIKVMYDRSENAETQRNMTEVENAIQAYADEHGSLPCPADDATGVSGDCAPVAYDSTSETVLSGSIPWNTLGVAEEYARDSKGKPLDYNVAEKATSDDVPASFSAISNVPITVQQADDAEQEVQGLFTISERPFQGNIADSRKKRTMKSKAAETVVSTMARQKTIRSKGGTVRSRIDKIRRAVIGAMLSDINQTLPLGLAGLNLATADLTDPHNGNEVGYTPQGSCASANICDASCSGTAFTLTVGPDDLGNSFTFNTTVNELRALARPCTMTGDDLCNNENAGFICADADLIVPDGEERCPVDGEACIDPDEERCGVGDSCVSDGVEQCLGSESCIADSVEKCLASESCIAESVEKCVDGESCLSDGADRCLTDGFSCIDPEEERCASGDSCVSNSVEQCVASESCVADSVEKCLASESCLADSAERCNSGRSCIDNSVEQCSSSASCVADTVEKCLASESCLADGAERCNAGRSCFNAANACVTTHGASYACHQSTSTCLSDAVTCNVTKRLCSNVTVSRYGPYCSNKSGTYNCWANQTEYLCRPVCGDNLYACVSGTP
jgi:prepilin-type N-terminal cleavage/methylation domain-containing protein